MCYKKHISRVTNKPHEEPFPGSSDLEIQPYLDIRQQADNEYSRELFGDDFIEALNARDNHAPTNKLLSSSPHD